MSLEWIKMRADINKMEPETFGAKFSRKVKENPFVPFGKSLFSYDETHIILSLFSFGRLLGNLGRSDLRFVQL